MPPKFRALLTAYTHPNCPATGSGAAFLGLSQRSPAVLISGNAPSRIYRPAFLAGTGSVLHMTVPAESPRGADRRPAAAAPLNPTKPRWSPDLRPTRSCRLFASAPYVALWCTSAQYVAVLSDPTAAAIWSSSARLQPVVPGVPQYRVSAALLTVNHC